MLGRGARGGGGVWGASKGCVKEVDMDVSMFFSRSRVPLRMVLWGLCFSAVSWDLAYLISLAAVFVSIFLSFPFSLPFASSFWRRVHASENIGVCVALSIITSSSYQEFASLSLLSPFSLSFCRSSVFLGF